MSNKQNDEINEQLWQQASDIAHYEIKDPSEYQIEVRYKDLLNKLK